MIQTKIDVNGKEEELVIRYPNVDYSYYKDINHCKNDTELSSEIVELISRADCTELYDNKQVLKTSNFNYKDILSKIYYYMLRLNNQIAYNGYLEMIILIHTNNRLFEESLPKEVINTPKVSNRKSYGTRKRYTRIVSVDMFTGEETYIYQAEGFGKDKAIYSNSPDLLDENGYMKPKPKKAKTPRVKSSGAVPFSSMVFTFDKKK